MAKITLHATVKFAWWWKPYCHGVILMARLTGLKPNLERVAYWQKRAATILFDGRKR